MASKTVLITGASSGIGRALAVEFARTGEYNLALTARRVDRLTELKEELLLLNPGIKVEFRELDVVKFHDIAPVFDDLVKSFGRIDLVVANAGVFAMGQIGAGDVDNNKRVIDTNFTGAVTTIDTAVAHFKKVGGGHVVGISSALAFKGHPGTAVYSATKAALNLYLEVLREEVRKQSIEVTAIYPGLTESEMTAGLGKVPHMITAESAAQKILALIKDNAPQGIVPLL